MIEDCNKVQLKIFTLRMEYPLPRKESGTALLIYVDEDDVIGATKVRLFVLNVSTDQ